MSSAPTQPADAGPGAQDPVTVAPPTSARRREPRAPRTRRVVAWILVVVVAVLVPISVLTVWSVRTLTNTDRYVATMAPLARDRAVTGYVAARATAKLFDEVNVEGRIAGALPKKASFIAAPVTTQLHAFTQKQATSLLQSQWFAEFWDSANRRIHSTLIRFLKGEPLPAGQKAQKIAISLTPVVDKVVTALDKRGVTVFDPVRAKLDKGAQANFSLADNQQVQKIRTVFRAASSLGWLVPLIALVLLVAALAVAVERRKTLLRAALGTAVAVVVTLAGLAIGRNVFINQAPNAPHDVTAAVFVVVTRFLSHSLKVVLLVSLVVAVVMWLAGPGRFPVWLRRHVWRGLCWLGRAVAGLVTPARRTAASSRARGGARWCLGHRSEMRLVGAGVAGAVVVFSAALSVGAVWLTLLLLVIYLLLLEVVFAWARHSSSAPATGDEGSTGEQRSEPAASGALAGGAASRPTPPAPGDPPHSPR